jgi:beta-glucosidase
VLLKNDKNILPLSNQRKKIAVIGPNAKFAMTSGGGSAKLLSTYAISPLDGILEAAKEKNDADVKYAVGAMTHKFLPLLDPYIQDGNGQPGADLEFWNEAPLADFIDISPDFSKELPPPVWNTSTLSSNCMLLDGIVSAYFSFGYSDSRLTP